MIGFANDERMFSVSGTSVTLWNTRTLEKVKTLPHPIEVSVCSPSSDGQMLLTSTADQYLNSCAAYVWRVADGSAVSKPLEHGDGLLHAVFDSKNQLVATASEDFTSALWKITGERLPFTLKHSDETWAIAFSPRDRMLLTFSKDRSVRIWDAETGDPISPSYSVPSSFAGGLKAFFSPTGNEVIVTHGTETWKIPILPAQKPVAELEELAILLSGDPSLLPGNSRQKREILRKTWNTLNSADPSLFRVSQEKEARFHLNRVAEAELLSNKKAASFHRVALKNLSSNGEGTR
jgi:WD40 repeat protein